MRLVLCQTTKNYYLPLIFSTKIALLCCAESSQSYMWTKCDVATKSHTPSALGAHQEGWKVARHQEPPKEKTTNTKPERQTKRKKKQEILWVFFFVGKEEGTRTPISCIRCMGGKYVRACLKCHQSQRVPPQLQSYPPQPQVPGQPKLNIDEKMETRFACPQTSAWVPQEFPKFIQSIFPYFMWKTSKKCV